MSKPMTKNEITEMKNYIQNISNCHEIPVAVTNRMLTLIAEVERLKRLAVPNRAPKTRTKSDEPYMPKSNYEAMRIADDNGMSYGQRIYSRNKVDGDGYPCYDSSRERY